VRAVKASRVAALLVGIGALLLAPSCAIERGAAGANGAGGSSDSAAKGALLRGATWTLTWDKARVTPIEEGGWAVSTDLGYRVHVTSGWLVSYSVSLGCRGPRASLRSATVAFTGSPGAGMSGWTRRSASISRA
jgi:hypothetical protein